MYSCEYFGFEFFDFWGQWLQYFDDFDIFIVVLFVLEIVDDLLLFQMDDINDFINSVDQDMKVFMEKDFEEVYYFIQCDEIFCLSKFELIFFICVMEFKVELLEKELEKFFEIIKFIGVWSRCYRIKGVIS